MTKAACAECGSNENIVDAILNGEQVSLCSRCAEATGAIVVKAKPKRVVEESEFKLSVRERLARLTGLVEKPQVEDSSRFILSLARQRLGISVARLSALSGVPERVIERLESGKSYNKKVEKQLLALLKRLSKEKQESKHSFTESFTVGDLQKMKRLKMSVEKITN